MNRPSAPTERQWRLLYDRTAPALVIFCLLASLFSSVGVWYNDRVNGEQDRARTEDNMKLLACFDKYAELQSASSVAVREASVRKDAATSIRDDALAAEGRAFKVVAQHIIAGDLTPAQVQRLAETLEQRAKAARMLDRAQDALDKARRENPVPEPPSTFCSVQP